MYIVTLKVGFLPFIVYICVIIRGPCVRVASWRSLYAYLKKTKKCSLHVLLVFQIYQLSSNCHWECTTVRQGLWGLWKLRGLNNLKAVCISKKREIKLQNYNAPLPPVYKYISWWLKYLYGGNWTYYFCLMLTFELFMSTSNTFVSISEMIIYLSCMPTKLSRMLT